MKLAIVLSSNVITMAIAQVAKAFGSEVVESADEADAVIAERPDDLLRYLKRGKQVAQYLLRPDDEPATGLLTAYPDRFRVARVIEGKGAGGTEALINWLIELGGKRENSGSGRQAGTPASGDESAGINPPG